MRPEDAKRLAEDENLKEVFTLLREKYHKDFESATDDSLIRIRLKFDLIREFYGEFQRVINEEAMRK